MTKEVKDLFAANYNTLIKETKGDSRKWKIPHALGLE